MRLISIILGALLGGLLLFQPGVLPILLGVGLALAVTVVWKPLLGLLLFCFFATLIPYTTVNIGFRITLSEAMLGLTWVGVGWQLLVGKRHWHLGKTEYWLIGLMVFSVLPFIVGQISIQASGSGVVNWLRWLLNLSPLLLIPILLDTPESQDEVVATLLFGNTAMLLLSLGYFLKTHDANSFIPVLEKLRYAHPEAVKDIFSANYVRMASPWVHPNLTGGVLVLFIPIAFFYAQWRTGWRRLLGIAVSLLGSAGLLFSISRGAILSLALVLVWMTWRRVPFAGRITGLGMTLGLALVLFYPPLQERLSTMFSSSNASTEIRMDEYRRFPDAVARYPLGIGFKTDPPPPDTGLLGISNLWLNFIYKIGILGTIIYIIVTFSWWREWRPSGWMSNMNEREALALGAGAGALSALLTGFFDHYYSFTTVLIALFWLMVSLNLQWVRAGKSPALPQAVNGRKQE